MGYPLQSVGRGKYQGDSTEGAITRPIGPMEATLAEVSSIKRITSQTIELLGRIYRRPIRVSLDSGYSCNSISDQVARSYDLVVQSEEGSEQLTLAGWIKSAGTRICLLLIAV